MVRCKMKVVERKDQMWYSAEKPITAVVLAAVTGEANKTWAKYTPSGKIELSIDNPDAYAYFEIGKTYFVDFNAAAAKEADEQK